MFNKTGNALVTLIVVVLCLSLFVKAANMHQPTDTGYGELDHLPEVQAFIIDRAHLGLSRLAEKSEVAKELLALYDTRHVEGAIFGDLEQIQLMVEWEDLPHSEWFMVTALPTRLLLEGNEVSATFSCAPAKWIIIADNLDTDVRIAGLELAHELAHYQDCVAGRYPTDENNVGPAEYVALLTTLQILEEYTEYAWHEAVVASYEERITRAEADGKVLEDLIFTGYSPEEAARLQALFGDLDPETESRFASFLIQHINDVHVEVLGIALGWNEAETLHQKIETHMIQYNM